MLEAQHGAYAHKGDVPDSELLHAYAELAKPSMEPLNIVCASSGPARVSLLAYGDFLLAELGAEHAQPNEAAWRVLHVRSQSCSPAVTMLCSSGKQQYLPTHASGIQ